MLVAVFLLARAHGGYNVDAWAPAAVAAILAVALLSWLGRRPSRLVACASGAFVALGALGLLSAAWGGIPEEAWGYFARTLLGAGALCLGCLLSAYGRSEVVVFAVLAGIALSCAEILFAPIVGWSPDDWYYSRSLEGTVGYHNAQSNLCAIGIVLATTCLADPRAWLRGLAGAAGGIFVATALLTQSRAGLGVAVLGVVVVLLWTRDAMHVVRVIPFVPAVLIMSLVLRDVDRALVGDGAVDDALRRYALIATAVAVALAAAAVPAITSRRLRRGLAAGAAVLAAVAIGGAATFAATSGVIGDAVSGRNDSNPNLTEPGSTRILSGSLNGRHDAWRIASDMTREQPLLGHGLATFTARYIRDRTDVTLFVLQPHSLVLETLSELGLVGLALLFTALALAAAAAIRGPDRRLTAAALGVLTALVCQAAVDWTWSFPILVTASLLVVGAAASPATIRRIPVGASIVVAIVSLTALVAVSALWVSDRAVEQAADLQTKDPARAVARLDDALRWNRWNAAGLELRGLIAERSAAWDEAAYWYDRAATHTRSGWLDYFRVARVAKAADDESRRSSACSLAVAANPGERRLREALC